jgi:hypothetical protein
MNVFSKSMRYPSGRGSLQAKDSMVLVCGRESKRGRLRSTLCRRKEIFVVDAATADRSPMSPRDRMKRQAVVGSDQIRQGRSSGRSLLRSGGRKRRFGASTRHLPTPSAMQCGKLNVSKFYTVNKPQHSDQSRLKMLSLCTTTQPPVRCGAQGYSHQL